ncbi:MAG: hypothetical protein HKM05_04305 [Spirochaetales bacterium]|nr:hypothetical protein [Spirochaetales bacterium]
MNRDSAVWESWKRALVTLPDTTFFAWMRHYLGPLQTPFNKQNLIQDLIQRVSSPDATRVRRLLLTDSDLDILAALKHLGPSSAPDLANWLDLSEAVLRLRLLNLEERLWLFHQTAPQVLYQVSPFTLEDEMAELLTETRFYAGLPAQPAGDVIPLATESHFLALYAALDEFPQELTQGQTWKKKPRAELLAKFAGLTPEDGLDKLLRACENLGLVTWDGPLLRLVDSYWEDLGRLSATDRTALLATAFGPWKGQFLNEAAKAFWEFASKLRPSTAYSWRTLRRFSGQIFAWRTPEDREALLKAWTTIGLFLPGPENDTWVFHPPLVTPGPTILEANFEWRLAPGSPWYEAWSAVRASRLLRCDRLSHFELTKPRVQHAIARGLTAIALQKSLSTLIGHDLPQNIAITIQEWEAQTRQVQLWSGLILRVDPAKAPLLQHAEQFAQAVLETLAPGVFLIDPDSLELVSRDLQQLGLPALPPPQTAKRPLDGSPWSFSRWSAPLPVVGEAPPPTWVPPVDPLPAQKLTEHWQKQIEDSPLQEEEKEELLGRLRRRLMIEERQLSFPVTHKEKLEARGLDFLGKMRLLEQVLANPFDLIDVETRQAEPADTLTLRPLKLDRQANEVLLKAQDPDSGKVYLLPISRLTRVRRLRGSLS